MLFFGEEIYTSAEGQNKTLPPILRKVESSYPLRSSLMLQDNVRNHFDIFDGILFRIKNTFCSNNKCNSINKQIPSINQNIKLNFSQIPLRQSIKIFNQNSS